MKRILYPPHWALIGLGTEWALARWLPLAIFHGGWPAGLVLCALGLALILWPAMLFRRKKTGIRPFSESTALVVEGPYRFSRNPIYLGMTLFLVGAAVAMGAAGALLVPPAFALLIQTRFIIPEEAHMERALGAEYLALKARVRRWL